MRAGSEEMHSGAAEHAQTIKQAEPDNLLMSGLALDSIENQTARSRFERILNYLRKDWLRCLFIAALGFAVHFPALQGQPLWDDDRLIRSNPFTKSPVFILETFRHYLFEDSYSAHYRPVQNLSYMADYFIWNTNFYGFHLSSVLFHVAGGILLYLLLSKLLKPLLGEADESCAQVSPSSAFTISSWLPLFVALIWVVHPVHSAAVDYVSGRADSIAFALACASWLLFLKARELRRRFYRHTVLFVAGFCGLLALCSRESACIWIAIFLLYLFAFEKEAKIWRKWAILAGCLLIFAAYVGLRHLPSGQRHSGPSNEWPPSLRAVLMLRALGDYGRLMIFPSNLHMERTVYEPVPFVSGKGRWKVMELEYLSIAGLTVLAALILLALRQGNGQRLRIFGAAWFLIAYLPISNLIDLNATVAEHWLYLPSVGFLIFLAGCVLDLPSPLRRSSAAFACIAILALGTRSTIRSANWLNNETFARQTIASGGASIRVALLLAEVFANRGEYAEAETLLRKALQLGPEHPIARNNLADALYHQGKQKEAEALFADTTQAAQETRKDYPRTWIAALNFSHLLHERHDDEAAVAVLEKARRDYPNTWELISSESEVLREMDRLDEALDLIRPFAQNNWWHHRAWLALGHLAAQKGDIEGATSALRHASWLDIHEPAALNMIALMRMRQNRLDDACRIQRRAVARQPDEPRQYLLLSNILDKMGRDEESRAAMSQVARLKTLAQSKVVN